jgi:chromosome condensin MukBEF complex kleisin-like MukF subunit
LAEAEAEVVDQEVQLPTTLAVAEAEDLEELAITVVELVAVAEATADLMQDNVVAIQLTVVQQLQVQVQEEAVEDLQRALLAIILTAVLAQAVV